MPNLPDSPPIVVSRILTIASSINTSKIPVLVKSNSVVSSVKLAIEASFLAAKTAKAEATNVPPTQNPRILI